jgi:hypothetical protein
MYKHRLYNTTQRNSMSEEARLAVLLVELLVVLVMVELLAELLVVELLAELLAAIHKDL